jgi:hypothetical protein
MRPAIRKIMVFSDQLRTSQTSFIVLRSRITACAREIVSSKGNMPSYLCRNIGVCVGTRFSSKTLRARTRKDNTLA